VRVAFFSGLFVLVLSLGLFATPERHESVLPDFHLTAVTVDETKVVERKDFEGKVWIANFIFTRCNGPCPFSSGKMGILQKKLPAGIILASFTVDPEYDQDQALREYAKRFHAEPKRWMFLTAPDEKTLIPLFKDAFHTAYRPNPSSSCGYETWHSTKFFLIDRHGAIRGEYASTDTKAMWRLEADARLLFKKGEIQ